MERIKKGLLSSIATRIPKNHQHWQAHWERYIQRLDEKDPVEQAKVMGMIQMIDAVEEQQQLWREYHVGEERTVRMEKEAARVGLKLPQQPK